MDQLTAEKIIELLHLEPLPVEGGWYSLTYVSQDKSALGLPERYSGSRAFGSAIYYLLTADTDCFSALHRLLTDEIYHFYLGDPVELLLLKPGGECQRVILGSDIIHDQKVQFTVPAGAWQGSHLLPGGRFALMGTTMAPGYDHADFTLGKRSELQAGWPGEAALIAKLIRS